MSVIGVHDDRPGPTSRDRCVPAQRAGLRRMRVNDVWFVLADDLPQCGQRAGIGARAHIRAQARQPAHLGAAILGQLGQGSFTPTEFAVHEERLVPIRIRRPLNSATWYAGPPMFMRAMTRNTRTRGRLDVMHRTVPQ